MNSMGQQYSQIQQHGFVMPITSGNSMRPLIWGKCHRVVVIALDAQPAVNDLIFFTHTIDNAPKNIVHRIVEIKEMDGERIYITRGDNCLKTETVRHSDIIGRVAEVHRLSGFRPWHAIPRKKFAVTDRAYIRYSRFWGAIWPVRRLYYLMRAHFRGLCARVGRICKSR